MTHSNQTVKGGGRRAAIAAVLCLVAALGLPALANQFNLARMLAGIPLGFLMAAVGPMLLIAAVLIVFHRQEGRAEASVAELGREKL